MLSRNSKNTKLIERTTTMKPPHAYDLQKKREAETRRIENEQKMDKQIADAETFHYKNSTSTPCSCQSNTHNEPLKNTPCHVCGRELL
jgi:hypothetical protein